MKHFFFLVLLALVTISCSKESDNDLKKSPCEVNRTATLTVANSHDNPYYVYINNTYSGTLNGNGITSSFDIPEGNGLVLYAEQASGYLLFPTTHTTKMNIVRCSNYDWVLKD